VQDLTFVSATGYSHAHLTTVFLPSSMDERFKALRSDMNIVVQIMNGMSAAAIEMQKHQSYWDKYRLLWDMDMEGLIIRKFNVSMDQQRALTMEMAQAS
jgi:hypothetical protein